MILTAGQLDLADITSMSRENQRTVSKFTTILIVTGFVGLATLLYLIPLLNWSIRVPLKSMCEEAQAEFGKDCVESLCAYLESDKHTLSEKNQAIWALGQMADPRALTTLEKFYTGEPCPKPCNKEDRICQYELAKAIQWCNEGTLFSRWMGGLVSK
jgi:hypothetical protein